MFQVWYRPFDNRKYAVQQAEFRLRICRWRLALLEMQSGGWRALERPPAPVQADAEADAEALARGLGMLQLVVRDLQLVGREQVQEGMEEEKMVREEQEHELWLGEG